MLVGLTTALAAAPVAAPAEAADVASTSTAVATFTGPVTTGHTIEPETALPTDLAAHGYVEQEFFAGGTAHAFNATSAPSDGRWTIAPTTSASYETRILVRRPSNPARFSGTVVVEWMNESEGESAPDWDYLNPELMDAGDAYVAVSAQALGVEGGTPILGSVTAGVGQGLIQQEPQRYGTLHHPGDQYALDIFDQIGLGLRAKGSDVLGPLKPRHVVATGESQSAFYLTTFADALEPLSHAFDGIFIHSRGGAAAPLNGSSITSASAPAAVRIRTDLHVPVFMFETQTDMIQLGYARRNSPTRPTSAPGRSPVPRMRTPISSGRPRASSAARAPSTPARNTWSCRRPSPRSCAGWSTGPLLLHPRPSSCSPHTRPRWRSTRTAT